MFPSTPLMEKWFEDFYQCFLYGMMEKFDLSICDLGKVTYRQYRFSIKGVQVNPAYCEILLNSGLWSVWRSSRTLCRIKCHNIW